MEIFDKILVCLTTENILHVLQRQSIVMVHIFNCKTEGLSLPLRKGYTGEGLGNACYKLTVKMYQMSPTITTEQNRSLSTCSGECTTQRRLYQANGLRRRLGKTFCPTNMEPLPNRKTKN